MYVFTEWGDAEEGVAPIPSDHLLTFWTPVLGPSAVLVLRTLGLCLRHQDPWRVSGAELGAMIGLRGEGRNAPLVRTLVRLEQFEFIRKSGPYHEVRLSCPDLSARQFGNLPSVLKIAYGLERERSAS